MVVFTPAVRHDVKLRMAIDGPSGCGKTYTALRLAQSLAAKGNHRIAVIDTEYKSASKYLGEAPDGVPFQFDTCQLTNFSPTQYTSAIMAAGKAGFGVLVIDSLSHAWEGKGGALDQVDNAKGNKFTAWKDVTPQHRGMVEAILSSNCHVVATMRSKMEHVLEQNSAGKMVPKKVGMAPIQRQGTEYEFDIVCDMDLAHLLTVSKTRCSAVDGLKIPFPGPDFLTPIYDWLVGPRVVPYYGPSPLAPVMQAYQQVQTMAPHIPPIGAAPVDIYQQQSDDFCNPHQVERIIDMAKMIGLTIEQTKAVIAKRGVQTAAELTVTQAEEIITNMTQMYSAGQIMSLMPGPAMPGPS